MLRESIDRRLPSDIVVLSLSIAAAAAAALLLSLSFPAMHHIVGQNPSPRRSLSINVMRTKACLRRSIDGWSLVNAPSRNLESLYRSSR